jgi:hypothetical protein
MQISKAIFSLMALALMRSPSNVPSPLSSMPLPLMHSPPDHRFSRHQDTKTPMMATNAAAGQANRESDFSD